MKTKKLIELLQKEDPTGEAEVCIGNEDISPCLWSEPGYYDGRLQLVTGWNGNHPTATTITSGGSKIKLRPIDLHDVFTESIMQDNVEYTITTEGDRFNSDWTRWAYWRLDRLKWITDYIMSVRDHKFYTGERERKIFAKCEEVKQRILSDGRTKFEEYVATSSKNKHMPEICAERLMELARFLWSKFDLVLEPQAHGKDYVVTRAAGKYFPAFHVSYKGEVTVVTEVWISDPDRVGYRKQQPSIVQNYLEYDWDTYYKEYTERLGRDE